MTIDDHILNGIYHFAHEARARYADPKDADVAWSIAERVAEIIHKDVETLSTASDGVSWSELRAAMASRDLDEDLDFALQARLAVHFGPSYEDVAARAWQLATLLKASSQPEAVKRFLGSIARCYLLGFTPECLVMCRGALENGINARFAEEQEPFPTDTNGYQSMGVRIRHAETKGWLQSGTASDLISFVWHRGSKAAHADTQSVGDALQSIQLTLAALHNLRPVSFDPDAS